MFSFNYSFAEAREDIPVEIEAEQMHFDGKKETVIASGNVIAKFKEIKIEADYIELDSKNDILSGGGNVVFTKDNETLTCKSFIYNIDKEETKFNDFKFELLPEDTDAVEKIYLHAKEVTDRDERRWGTDGNFTTCDYKKPHYRISAKKFKYYPDKYLIGYHVVFKEGKAPLFYFPIYYYDLRKRKLVMSMPVFGKNDVEGFFIKSAFDYFINPSHFGIFYIDRMSRKGWGKGLRHNIIWNDSNETSIYYYGLKERDTKTKDNIINIKHKASIGENLTLNLEEKFSNIYLIPSGREHRTKTYFDLNYNKDKFNTSIKYDLNRNIISSVNDNFVSFDFRKGSFNTSITNRLSDYIRNNRKDQTVNFKIGQNLFWNVNYAANFNYRRVTEVKGQSPDERLDTNLSFKHASPYYGSTTVEFSLYDDLDGDVVTKDNTIDYIEKKPEITVNFKRLNLRLFDWSNSVVISKLKESRFVSSANQSRVFETKRYQLKTDLNKSLTSKRINTTLSYSFGLDQRLYDPGDALYFFTEHIGLSTKQLNFIRNDINFDRRISNGNSPFFFESKGQEANTLNDKLKFFVKDENRYFMSFASGYNFVARKFDNLQMELNIDPQIKYGKYKDKMINPFNLNFKSAYDFENNKWLDLIGRINITPHRDFKGRIDFIYDLDRNELERAESLFNFQLGWKNWKYIWYFQIRHAWDFQAKKYYLEDFVITKDLHCQQLSFAYNRLRKEYRLTFTIKAFPDMPFGLFTGKEGFQIEGFMSNESVRRY